MYKIKKREHLINDYESWAIFNLEFLISGEEHGNIIRKHYKINRTRDNQIYEGLDNNFKDILAHLNEDDFEDND